MYTSNQHNNHIGPVDSTKVPRYSGIGTFARLPRLEECPDGRADVVVLGVPFDAAVTYRPGARFGPSAIREASRLLRGYNPSLDVEPFVAAQVADAGDVTCHPYDIRQAIESVESASTKLRQMGASVVALGGDHSIALPLLRSVHAEHGPVALIHFDAHLDTWPAYFETELTHGTPFRLAFEEGLTDFDAVIHVGTRGPLYSRDDLPEDTRMGFTRVTAAEVMRLGVDQVSRHLRELVGDRPLYVSVDIDVLDPSSAPGTGTPEAGGITSRELLEILRGLDGCRIVGADVVEVSPTYDHAEITAVAASHVVFELISLIARSRGAANE